MGHGSNEFNVQSPTVAHSRRMPASTTGKPVV
jgi:hypothetical protein